MPLGSVGYKRPCQIVYQPSFFPPFPSIPLLFFFFPLSFTLAYLPFGLTSTTFSGSCFEWSMYSAECVRRRSIIVKVSFILCKCRGTPHTERQLTYRMKNNCARVLRHGDDLNLQSHFGSLVRKRLDLAYLRVNNTPSGMKRLGNQRERSRAGWAEDYSLGVRIGLRVEGENTGCFTKRWRCGRDANHGEWGPERRSAFQSGMVAVRRERGRVEKVYWEEKKREERGVRRSFVLAWLSVFFFFCEERKQSAPPILVHC